MSTFLVSAKRNPAMRARDEHAGSMLAQFLTLDEVAERLGVSRTTVHNRVHSGALKGYRLRGQWLFKPSEVMS